MSGFQNSRYGGRGRSGAAATFGSLTQANLSTRPNLTARNTDDGDTDDDDVMSTKSCSSIATFKDTFHSILRSTERNIEREKIGEAIKKGKLISIEEGKSMMVYNDIVVIVTTNDIDSMRLAEKNAIVNQILVETGAETEGINGQWPRQTSAQTKKVAVTAWRLENTYPLDTDEEYQLLADFTI